ncbi:MAG: Sir2 histone deacetylase Hst2 [Bogoriella megaspora]|nr:MAG: Sir2 histone deacetylase Hst2 [Bogoriella megaspora]
MGQEGSSPIDESVPPESLSSRTIDGVAEYIKSGKARRIVVMTGAGISTSAGIPDFRSPETGLYANLARLDLPYAEAVFNISYFRTKPEPFYTLAHELYPGRYRPTITHSFISLLHKKGLLLQLFTQNIDCLEREAGVPDDKIVEAHGSFATQRCIECRTPFPDKEMKEYVDRSEVPHCPRKECGGLVKPDIVFFGEQLPAKFFQEAETPAAADLCFVMGTSLQVQPFASLPEAVSRGVPRVLLNLEQVGGLGYRADDVLVLGSCDDGVRKIAKACGWLDELEDEWSLTARADVNAGATAPEAAIPKNKDELLEEEVDKLTRDVEETLKLSSNHVERVKAEHASTGASTGSQEDKAGISQNRKGEKEDIKGSEDLRKVVDGSKDSLTGKVEQEVTHPSEGQGLDHVYPHIKKPSL